MSQFPKAYLRIDPNIDQVRPDLDRFIRLLCAANRQPERGYFKSETVALMVLGKPRYHHHLDRGDLVLRDDGRLYVDGWDHWQEGDITVADRMRALRERQRYGDVTATVTAPLQETIRSNRNAPPTPTPVVTLVPGEGVRRGGGDDPVADTLFGAYGGNPSTKVLEWGDRLAETYGAESAAQAIGAALLDGREGLMGRAEGALKLAARQAEKVEAAEERARLREKRAPVHIDEPDPARVAEILGNIGDLFHE